MAKYTSMESLKAALMDALVAATNNMAEMVEDEVKDATKRYYEGYAPGSYERTGTLEKAPKRTPATQNGDVASAEVYLDTSLQYHTGTWSMENVISAAENMTHGGKNVGEGVSIWRQPMQEVSAKSHEMWKKALTDAGLNVK